MKLSRTKDKALKAEESIERVMVRQGQCIAHGTMEDQALHGEKSSSQQNEEHKEVSQWDRSPPRKPHCQHQRGAPWTLATKTGNDTKA